MSSIVNSGIKKALIIRKPWINMILDGSKTWEMRSRYSRPQGKIALIESGSGLIVGECVHIGSWDRITDKEEFTEPKKFHGMSAENIDLIIGKWDVPWELRQAMRYENPIGYQHPQGAVTWVNLQNLIK